MIEPSTVIDFLRHGHCQGGEIFRGSTDVELSTEGWQQLRRTVGDNSGKWTRIVCSPLLRCQLFAHECAEKWGIPIEVDPRWQEMSFGHWEGRLVSEVLEQDREGVMAFFHDPMNKMPEGAEPMSQIVTRLQEGWLDIKQKYPGERVLVVAHGGVIRIHLAQLLGLKLSAISQLHQPYAALNRVGVFERKLGSKEIVMFMNGQA